MDESKPLQGASMIDLRSPDAVLSEYAQRYIDLVPDVSPPVTAAHGVHIRSRRAHIATHQASLA